MRPKTKAKPRQNARSRPSGKGPSPASRPVDLDDNALLDLVQRQTLRYFWDFAHPESGLARERSNIRPEYGLEVVTEGGSGFGVMAIIVGVARGWIGRAEAVQRLLTMVHFLLRPTAITACCRISCMATPARRFLSPGKMTGAT
jgi:hypothetical protein